MRKMFVCFSIGLFFSFLCAKGTHATASRETSAPTISGIVPCERQINEMMTALEVPTLNSNGWNFIRQGKSYTRAGLNETIGGPGQIDRSMEEDIPRLEKKLSDVKDRLLKVVSQYKDKDGADFALLSSVCSKEKDCPKELMAKQKENSSLLDKMRVLENEKSDLYERIRTLKNRPFDLTIIYGDSVNFDSKAKNVMVTINSLRDQEDEIDSKIALYSDALDITVKNKPNEKAFVAYSQNLAKKIERLKLSLTQVRKKKHEMENVLRDLEGGFNKTTVFYYRSDNPKVIEYIQFCHQRDCLRPQLDLKNCQWIGLVKADIKVDPHIDPAPRNLGEFCISEVHADLHPCPKVAKETCSSKQFYDLPEKNRSQCIMRGLRPAEKRTPTPSSTPAQ